MVWFVALAPYSTLVQHGMTLQWNSQRRIRRKVFISLWFGSYISSCFAWRTCLPKPVTDWQKLIPSDRLRLVLCIYMCLNSPKAPVPCCIPGDGPALEKRLTPCWKLSASLVADGSPPLDCHHRVCFLLAQRWGKRDERQQARVYAGCASGTAERLGAMRKVWPVLSGKRGDAAPAWKAMETQGETLTRERALFQRSSTGLLWKRPRNSTAKSVFLFLLR